MARTYNLKVESSMTIKQLKKLFLEKADNKKGIETICFKSDDEILDDNDSTIASYGVEDKAILQLVNLNANDRNDFCMGVKFVEISNSNGLKRKNWSKTAPSWRRTRYGLCLEGLCTNKQCEAHNRRVIMPIGYMAFNITTDASETTTKCPSCKQYVEPITCGFNNCWWRYNGIKQNEKGKSPIKCSGNWQQTDDAYHYFDEGASGIVVWKQLIIEAVKKRPSE